MIDEQTIDFGNGVFGVLTRPEQPMQRPVVLLLNAGFIHRVGPFRLHVDLARELAALGFAVVRVDEPGVGDAPPKRDPDTVGAIARALDQLEVMLGVDTFVVGGLCSAADIGWKLALADKRVRGLLLLDPLARRGLWFRIGQLRMLAARGTSAVPTVWRKLTRQHNPGDDPNLRDWPAAPQERADLAELTRRGVEVFALYSGGAAAYFTHRAQFAATFGSLAQHPRVHFEHWPDCDHLFMRAQDRTRLRRAICAWCTQAFAG